MKMIVPIPNDNVIPSFNRVSKELGVDDRTDLTSNSVSLFERALEIYQELARPIGIYSDISTTNFKRIFPGEGKNTNPTPLCDIYPLAENLVLFAITLGAEISERIEELFNEREFATGTIIDAVASVGTELSVDRLQSHYINNLKASESIANDTTLTLFSPGYCGWDISGQRELFEYLNPERIGISLNDSFLMTPLKSITGVMILGKEDIFLFDKTYPVCEDCETYSCREQMKKV